MSTDTITSGSSFELPIEGMTCASCVLRVEKAIATVPGTIKAIVNLATERASVETDGSVQPSAIIAAINSAGYETSVESFELEIEGMTCASCVGRIERALSAVPGVVVASVNLATEKAIISATGGLVTRAVLEATVKEAGYDVHQVAEAGSEPVSAADRKAAEARKLSWAFGLSAVLTAPLFVMEMGSHFIPEVHMFIMNTIGMQTNHYLQFILATVVLFGPGLRFFQKGIPALLRGAPDMNSLVVLGTSAAWGFSVVSTFFGGLLPAGTANVYFEAAAVIVTLILLGRLLEARAKGRTSQAIQRLVGLQAKTARVVRDGAVIELPLEAVRAGDRILICPGDKVPSMVSCAPVNPMWTNP